MDKKPHDDAFSIMQHKYGLRHKRVINKYNREHLNKDYNWISGIQKNTLDLYEKDKWWCNQNSN